MRNSRFDKDPLAEAFACLYLEKVAKFKGLPNPTAWTSLTGSRLAKLKGLEDAALRNREAMEAGRGVSRDNMSRWQKVKDWFAKPSRERGADAELRKLKRARETEEASVKTTRRIAGAGVGIPAVGLMGYGYLKNRKAQEPYKG
mgnify:CR=1 FL=1